MKKIRRHRIQDTGIGNTRRWRESKDNGDWRFQRECGKRFQNVGYVPQAGVDPGFMDTEAYTIQGSSLRKQNTKLQVEMLVWKWKFMYW